MSEPKKEKKGSTIWGVIALVIAIVSLMTPRLFLSIVIITLSIFTILGLIIDRSKIPSVIALVILGLILYGEFDDAVKSGDTYSVRYEVVCSKCEVSYMNSTGGSTKVEDVSGLWSETIDATGDMFIKVSAQNENVDRDVTAKIFVNNVLLKESTSSGKYQIADVYGNAKDIHSK